MAGPQSALLAALLAAALPAAAADLVQVFQDAVAYDAQYASARAALQAGLEKLPQGRALLLPSLSASANATYNDNRVSFQTPVNPGPFNRAFESGGWAVTLSQPLFRRQNELQYSQAEFQVKQAQAQFSQATQDLVLRVAQAYFDVLAAQDTIAVIRAQKAAISEQLEQAKRNFEVGTATITDTHEAQARFDLATSQEIATQSDLEIRQRALQLLIGRYPDTLSPLRPELQLAPPRPADMDRWVDTAQAQNFAVQVQEASVEIAGREIERNRAARLPTVDLVGSLGNNLAGGNVQSGIGSDQRFAVIGVQLGVPLYTGGLIDSRTREAIANRDRARADLDTSRRQAALSARQSFLGVTNGMAQVRALEQALVSSETALASNRLGYEVGVRINIDVLNAQQQVFSTRRDLSRARYDTILNGLRLKAAAGILNPTDIEEVNRLLVPQ